MSKIKVMSRYNEPRYFEKIKEGYIYNFKDKYCRISILNDKYYQFVDPDGGPNVSINTNLSDIHPNLKGVVNKIEKVSKGYKITII